MKTLYLRHDTWDLALDTQGNIAIGTDVYQQAQDIASSCRVFYGDDYYNKTDGIPYLESILGKSNYPISLYQKHLHERSMIVDGIVSVNINLNPLRDRLLSGNIEFTNTDNVRGVVGL